MCIQSSEVTQQLKKKLKALIIIQILGGNTTITLEKAGDDEYVIEGNKTAVTITEERSGSDTYYVYSGMLTIKNEAAGNDIYKISAAGKKDVTIADIAGNDTLVVSDKTKDALTGETDTLKLLVDLTKGDDMFSGDLTVMSGKTVLAKLEGALKVTSAGSWTDCTNKFVIQDATEGTAGYVSADTINTLIEGIESWTTTDGSFDGTLAQAYAADTTDIISATLTVGAGSWT